MPSVAVIKAMDKNSRYDVPVIGTLVASPIDEYARPPHLGKGFLSCLFFLLYAQHYEYVLLGCAGVMTRATAPFITHFPLST